MAGERLARGLPGSPFRIYLFKRVILTRQTDIHAFHKSLIKFWKEMAQDPLHSTRKGVLCSRVLLLARHSVTQSWASQRGLLPGPVVSLNRAKFSLLQSSAKLSWFPHAPPLFFPLNCLECCQILVSCWSLLSCLLGMGQFSVTHQLEEVWNPLCRLPPDL